VIAQNSAIASLPPARELCLITDPDGGLDLAGALSNRWTPYHADTAIHRFLARLRWARSGGLISHGLSRLLRRVGIVPPPYSVLRYDQWFGKDNVTEATERLIKRITRFRAVGQSWTGSVHWQKRAVFYEAGPLSETEAYTAVGQFFRDLFQTLAGPGKTHWVDDTPENMVRAAELLRMFPEAKIIHIFRHPLDILASYRQQSWSSNDVESIAIKLAALLGRWVTNRSNLPSGQILEFSLEKLVEDPKRAITQLCQFVDIPRDDRFFVSLNAAHSGRWRQELTPDEVRVARAHLEPMLQAFGYEK
jgi:hypothetical protein